MRLRAFVLALALVAIPVGSAHAQCRDLLASDRAPLVARTIHGRQYLEHPSLGFRVLAPDLPAATPEMNATVARLAADRGIERRFHSWLWGAGVETVQVFVECAAIPDGADHVARFTRGMIGSMVRDGGMSLVASHDAATFSDVELHGPSSTYVITRNRRIEARGQALILSVTATRLDVGRAQRTIASISISPGIGAGAPARAAIQAAIREHVRDVQLCYERALATQPGLTGRVTVSFIIDANGDVQRAEISGTTIGDPAVEDCIREVAYFFRFPMNGAGGVVGVNYPFVLTTTDSARPEPGAQPP